MNYIHIKRLAATFITAAAIYFCYLFSITEPAVPAILISCIIGSINASAGSGLCMIAALLSGQNAFLFAGAFTGSCVSGIIATVPVEEEKKFKIKQAVRNTAAPLAGFFVNYITQIIFTSKDLIAKQNFSIFNTIILICLSFILSSLLRPIAGKILYGKKDREKEIQSLIKYD